MKRAEEWSVFRRSDGGWVLRYQVDPNVWKQHRLGQYVSEELAKRAARAWLAAQEASGALPDATKTIDDLAEKWLAMRSANPQLAGSTVADNRDQLKNHIRPELGGIPIGRIDPKRLREWVRGLRERVSPFRCHNIVNTLSAFYEDARAEGWVKSSENVVRHPAVRKELPEARSVIEETVTLSLATAQALIGNELVEPHHRVRYMLGFTTGLRDGELAGLLRGDVLELDGDMPRLRVRRAFRLRQEVGSNASQSDPKTSESKRVVPLHPESAKALRWWLGEPWALFAAAPATDDAPLFPSPRTGAAWRPKSARDIRKDLAKIGLPEITDDGHDIDFHATRRSFHTWLTEAGVDATIRQRLMGHAGKTTGERHYTGLLLARMLQAVETIPLRWGVAVLSEPGSVRVPFTEGTLSAHQVQLHQYDAQTAVGRLSSVVEQRFRNSLPSGSEAREYGREGTLAGNGEREGIGSPHADAGPNRANRTVKQRALEDEALGCINAMIDLVTDGQTVLTVDARRERTEGLLARVAELLDKRDRKVA